MEELHSPGWGDRAIHLRPLLIIGVSYLVWLTNQVGDFDTLSTRIPPEKLLRGRIHFDIAAMSAGLGMIGDERERGPFVREAMDARQLKSRQQVSFRDNDRRGGRLVCIAMLD